MNEFDRKKPESDQKYLAGDKEKKREIENKTTCMLVFFSPSLSLSLSLLPIGILTKKEKKKSEKRREREKQT